MPAGEPRRDYGSSTGLGRTSVRSEARRSQPALKLPRLVILGCAGLLALPCSLALADDPVPTTPTVPTETTPVVTEPAPEPAPTPDPAPVTPTVVTTPRAKLRPTAPKQRSSSSVIPSQWKPVVRDRPAFAPTTPPDGQRRNVRVEHKPKHDPPIRSQVEPIRPQARKDARHVVLSLERPRGPAAFVSPEASNSAVVSFVLALIALASLLLAAAAVPPALLPWRPVAVLFHRRRAAIAIYGLAALLVAGFTYAMAAFPL